MTERRAVVTGGAGFIGSHTVDLLLADGWRVVVVDDFSGGRSANLDAHRNEPRLDILERDIRGLSDDPFRAGDHVIHFAGIGDIVPSIERPREYMHTNVDGTVAVLEASRRAGAAAFVYAASSSCYGAAPVVPTPESAQIRLEYPYALSKYLGECAALHWQHVYGLPVTSIRIFNAYGPRQRTTGAYGSVFGVFLSQRLHGKPLTVVDDGSQRRDFVHVTDVARAFVMTAASPRPGEVFNIGAGDPQSVRRLAELVGGEIVHIPRRPGEPECTWADTSKIERTLGWRPVVSFVDGVRSMIDDIENWRDAPVWDETSIEQATKTWFQYLSK